MSRVLVLVVAGAVLTSSATCGGGEPPASTGADKENQRAGKATDPFPVLGPVPTADPSVRRDKEFRVPTQLRVRQTGKSVGVEATPDSLATVKVTVGKDMVTGLRHEVFVFRDAKLVLSGPGGLQSRPADNTYADIAASIGELGSKDLPPGETYALAVRLTLFETDIPTHHLWAPETGRYKALWTRVLTLEVELPPARLPVGRWSVTFANGVEEDCEIRKDGTASVVEPRRASDAKVEVKDGSFLIVYQDDRVERWTPVGAKLIVEHWHPGTQFPSGNPVVGIAKRTR
jgi:hypothetical protein